MVENSTFRNPAARWGAQGHNVALPRVQEPMKTNILPDKMVLSFDFFNSSSSIFKFLRILDNICLHIFLQTLHTYVQKHRI